MFETEEKIAQPFLVAVSAPDEGPTIGQQVWFLGYPFGDTALTSRAENQILPFIKRGTISAINGSKPEAVVLYIDGFNNPGFSGGPIVYWEGCLILDIQSRSCLQHAAPVNYRVGPFIRV